VLRLGLAVYAKFVWRWHKPGGKRGAKLRRFIQNRLIQRQRRARLVSTVMISTPKRGAAIKLLKHGKQHPRGIVYGGWAAAAVIGGEDFAAKPGNRV